VEASATKSSTTCFPTCEQQASRISVRVREVLAEYDLPYTTGPLNRQFWHTVRTICKLSLPDRFLTATSHDAPETASEEKFRPVAAHRASSTLMRPARKGADWIPRPQTALGCG